MPRLGPIPVVLLALLAGGGCAHRASEEPPSETLTFEVPGEEHALIADAPASAPTSPAPGARDPSVDAETALRAFRPLPTDRVIDLCRDPMLGHVRALLPGVTLCVHGVSARRVTVAHAGHEAVVVAWRDVRPTWVDGPVVHGQAALVDGRRVEEDDPASFWTHLSDLAHLPDAKVGALLQAVLLARGVYTQIVTPDEVGETLGGWPEARAFVERAPPGVRLDAAGEHVRIYGYREVVGRGVQCRELSLHVATLTRGGEVVVAPERTWAAGQSLGRPCGAALPLPVPDRAHGDAGAKGDPEP